MCKKEEVMKRMLVVAVMVMTALTAVAEQTNGLEVLMKSYVAAEAKLAGVVADAYRTVLADALVDAKKNGDLDGYGLVDAENKRFDNEKTLPATNLLPEVHAGRVSGISNEGLVRKVELLRKYVAALDGLLKQEMKADRMDAAKAVKDEKVRAEFLLAEAETKLPKVADKPTKIEKQEVDKPSIVGTWDVVYANTARRVYEFMDGGIVVVSGTGLGNGVKGSWKQQMKGVVVDAEQGKIEMWKVAGDGVWAVDHYNPKRNYPNGKPAVTGVARKR